MKPQTELSCAFPSSCISTGPSSSSVLQLPTQGSLGFIFSISLCQNFSCHIQCLQGYQHFVEHHLFCLALEQNFFRVTPEDEATDSQLLAMLVSKFPAIWKTCAGSCFFLCDFRHVTISEYSSSMTQHPIVPKTLLQPSESVRKAQLSTTFDLSDLTPQNSPHHVHLHSFSNLWKSHPAPPPSTHPFLLEHARHKYGNKSPPPHKTIPTCPTAGLNHLLSDKLFMSRWKQHII